MHTNDRRKAIGVIILAAILRVFFLLVSVDNGGDAIDRISKTQAWLESSSVQFQFGGWLPLHFWMVGGLATFVGDVPWAGRLLSLLLGILSLWVFWRTVAEAFDERTAKLSLIVFSLYTLHVGYSTTSSAEVSYLFFVLVGTLGLVRYLSTRKLSWLALCGTGLTLGAAIRYEAWVVMLGAGIALLFTFRPLTASFEAWKGRIWALLVFGLPAAIWPVFWMSYMWNTMGHPLYFVAHNRVWVAEQLAFSESSIAYRLLLPPGSVLLSLSPIATLAALFGWVRSFRDERARPLAVLLAVFAFVQFYQIVSGGVMSFARYTMTVGTLLACFAGPGFNWMVERWSPRFLPRLATLVFALSVINLLLIWGISDSRLPLGERVSSISPRLRFRAHVQEIGNFLKPRLSNADAIVVDNHNLECSMLLIASGLQFEPGTRAFKATVQPPETVLGYMQNQKPRFLVFSDRGVLRPYLPLPQDCNSIGRVQGMEFRCLFKNSVYRVYEISFSEN